MTITPADMAFLRRFSPTWSRLSDMVGPGINVRLYINSAQRLRDAGLVESKQHIGWLVWRSTERARAALAKFGGTP